MFCVVLFALICFSVAYFWSKFALVWPRIILHQEQHRLMNFLKDLISSFLLSTPQTAFAYDMIPLQWHL